MIKEVLYLLIGIFDQTNIKPTEYWQWWLTTVHPQLNFVEIIVYPLDKIIKSLLGYSTFCKWTTIGFSDWYTSPWMNNIFLGLLAIFKHWKFGQLTIWEAKTMLWLSISRQWLCMYHIRMTTYYYYTPFAKVLDKWDEGLAEPPVMRYLKVAIDIIPFLLVIFTLRKYNMISWFTVGLLQH